MLESKVKNNRSKSIIDVLIVDIGHMGAFSPPSDRLFMFCELLARYAEKIRVMCPKCSYPQVESRLRQCKIDLATPVLIPLCALNIDTKTQLIREWTKRIILATLIEIPKSVNIIFSISGDILFATLCFWKKIVNPRVAWVTMIDNVLPPPKKRTGNFFVNTLSYFANRVAVSMIRKKADLIFAISFKIKADLLKLGVTSKKVKVISNAISFRSIQKVAEPLKKEYSAIFMGRIHPDKGIFDLVKVWRLVCNKIPNAKIAIIGDGEIQTVRNFSREIQKFGLDSHFKLLGWLEGVDKFSALKKSKLFLFPSKDESWGISLMEGIACGLPAVTYDLPIYRELYPKGLLQTTPIGDIKMIADIVMRLLKDTLERKRLGNWGRVFASDFDWDKISKEMLRELSFLRLSKQ